MIEGYGALYRSTLSLASSAWTSATSNSQQSTSGLRSSVSLGSICDKDESDEVDATLDVVLESQRQLELIKSRIIILIGIKAGESLIRTTEIAADATVKQSSLFDCIVEANLNEKQSMLAWLLESVCTCATADNSAENSTKCFHPLKRSSLHSGSDRVPARSSLNSLSASSSSKDAQLPYSGPPNRVKIPQVDITFAKKVQELLKLSR